MVETKHHIHLILQTAIELFERLRVLAISPELALGCHFLCLHLLDPADTAKLIYHICLTLIGGTELGMLNIYRAILLLTQLLIEFHRILHISVLSIDICKPGMMTTTGRHHRTSTVDTVGDEIKIVGKTGTLAIIVWTPSLVQWRPSHNRRLIIVTLYTFLPLCNHVAGCYLVGPVQPP